jgi:hypothetical protein
VLSRRSSAMGASQRTLAATTPGCSRGSPPGTRRPPACALPSCRRAVTPTPGFRFGESRCVGPSPAPGRSSPSASSWPGRWPRDRRASGGSPVLGYGGPTAAVASPSVYGQAPASGQGRSSCMDGLAGAPWLPIASADASLCSWVRPAADRPGQGGLFSLWLLCFYLQKAFCSLGASLQQGAGSRPLPLFVHRPPRELETKHLAPEEKGRKRLPAPCRGTASCEL